jgi:hypothetical protein
MFAVKRYRLLKLRSKRSAAKIRHHIRIFYRKNIIFRAIFLNATQNLLFESNNKQIYLSVFLAASMAVWDALVA